MNLLLFKITFNHESTLQQRKEHLTKNLSNATEESRNKSYKAKLSATGNDSVRVLEHIQSCGTIPVPAALSPETEEGPRIIQNYLPTIVVPTQHTR